MKNTFCKKKEKSLKFAALQCLGPGLQSLCLNTPLPTATHRSSTSFTFSPRLFRSGGEAGLDNSGTTRIHAPVPPNQLVLPACRPCFRSATQRSVHDSMNTSTSGSLIARSPLLVGFRDPSPSTVDREQLSSRRTNRKRFYLFIHLIFNGRMPFYFQDDRNTIVMHIDTYRPKILTEI